jgi:hypothetical protein
VLNPIEEMIAKVRMIARNPLIAAKENFEEKGALTHIHELETGKKGKDGQ